MIPAALALSLAGGLLLGGAGEGDAASEYERFEGVWRFASVEVEGVRQPEVSYPAHRMIMASDGTYVVVQGPRVTHGTFELDPSRSPKHYRFTVTSGPAKGLTGIGIYEVERETLKLCLSLGGDQRPERAVGAVVKLHRGDAVPRPLPGHLRPRLSAATRRAWSRSRTSCRRPADSP